MPDIKNLNINKFLNKSYDDSSDNEFVNNKINEIINEIEIHNQGDNLFNKSLAYNKLLELLSAEYDDGISGTFVSSDSFIFNKPLKERLDILKNSIINPENLASIEMQYDNHSHKINYINDIKSIIPFFNLNI
ncbi:hypothetical protein [Candidatus Aquarickettsia rohweri]|uniref:Uncharacterized protein n=1 Tax=Candidatus Aquarickettsia rohweri TaxID=2602574 RepID=A0A3S0A4V3_9RICK|nr:hypothetical protein [Candidatus Aquarickettsia rohweri]RST62758.1 hypothetical protein EIC27_05950 [Candidatus Aquarickettsia rohweri]